MPIIGERRPMQVDSSFETPKTFMGIDSGESGGIAIMRTRNVVLGGSIISCVAMPKTERDVWDWIRDKNQGRGLTFAVIEKVQGYIGPGSAFPGSAMFSFGKGYGGLRMALIAAGIPFVEVPPRTWQKALGIPHRTKKESKGQWKNRLKARAQQIFPDVKVTLAVADALLIMEYCRRKQAGII